MSKSTTDQRNALHALFPLELTYAFPFPESPVGSDSPARNDMGIGDPNAQSLAGQPRPPNMTRQMPQSSLRTLVGGINLIK